MTCASEQRGFNEMEERKAVECRRGFNEMEERKAVECRSSRRSVVQLTGVAWA